MRKILVYLALCAVLWPKSLRIIARVERIDPITAVAEITSNEPLVQGLEYLVLNESGETMGTAADLQVRGPNSYSFRFDGRRRALSAGRRIVVVAQGGAFSALGDRPRAMREPKVRYESRDSAPMQYIPDGLLIAGNQQAGELHFVPADQNGKILNRFDIPAFYLDKHEVTVGQFRRYLEETRNPVPSSWVNLSANRPITRVSYRQAESYCAWAGKRLPSEFEWERAARGNQFISSQSEVYEDSHSYPVGAQNAQEFCVTRENSADPLDIDNLRDINSFGLIGMCGNAAEWTSSWLLPYRGNTNHDIRFGKKYKVIRGGSYEHSLEYAKSHMRLAGGIPSLARDRRAGFRCARSE